MIKKGDYITDVNVSRPTDENTVSCLAVSPSYLTFNYREAARWPMQWSRTPFRSFARKQFLFILSSTRHDATRAKRSYSILCTNVAIPYTCSKFRTSTYLL